MTIIIIIINNKIFKNRNINIIIQNIKNKKVKINKLNKNKGKKHKKKIDL